MKRSRIWFGLAVAITASLVTAGWSAGINAAPVVIGSVSWTSSMPDAMSRAKAQGKPILHLQMFGRLNDEFC
jgi:hypothetical protein